ncbi:hypothetical protein LshimejAT787_1200140 [Lyophyllum shimeji]|uniref:Uncharacterized protein n=1 Tax=Lyophyllum shimeji TaxID=47721 RepID=A0A9P3USK0_LYOSH|nr:hypothetical protein LshimejAT787_1200140 [Lyophyllum shimeji]
MSTPPDAPPAGPSTALIPLPPGFTLDQFLAFQSSLVTISITAAVAFGIVVWDYFYLLPNEYKFYLTTKKEEWETLAPYAFMTLRGAGVVSILATMCISSFQSNHCQAGLMVSQIAAVVAVITSGMAFGYRVMGLWGSRNKPVAAVVAATYVPMVVSWVAVASQYRAIDGPPTPWGSNCQLKPFVPWAPLSHAASCLYNTTILILLVMKFSEQYGQQSKVTFLAYRNSLAHAAIVTAASVTFLIIQTLPPDYKLSKQVALPFSTLVMATIGARVFLSLRLSRLRPSNASQVSRQVPEAYIPSSSIKASVQYKPNDKMAYVTGTMSPVPLPKSDFSVDSKAALSPYLSSSPRILPSASSAASSPGLSDKTLPILPQDFDTPPRSRPLVAPAPPIAPDLPQNPYTTFPPPPPSPPQMPQVMARDGSIDAATPLLATKFSIPRLSGKKSKQEDDYMKSTWI